MRDAPASSDRDEPTPDVDDLVFEFLERREQEGADALEELCKAHPARARALRDRVSALRAVGLLEPVPAGEVAFPERLGDFRLLEPLGGGGMGVVYRARQESLGREVALKLIRPEQLYFPGARERFQREVETIARMQHPGIVPVYTVGSEDGVPFFAMERILGCTLGDALDQLGGQPPPALQGADLARCIARFCGQEEAPPPAPLFAGGWVETCLRVVRAIAEALEHAHRLGILHRDIKPSNVMITPEGRVMLLDFGLSSTDDMDRITRTGSQIGSLPYMSPELLEGGTRAVDARSDVYSLGVTLYELLTLRLPFEARSTSALREAILDGATTPVRRLNPGASWEVETVCQSAMEREPERRYPSAAALALDLSSVLTAQPIRAHRAGTWLRVRRWCQRNPTWAVGGTLGLLLVVGGPSVLAWQQHVSNQRIMKKSAEVERANADLGHALELVDDQRARAEDNFRDALAAVDHMLARVGDEGLRDVPHMETVRRDLLEDALAFYQGFLAQRGEDPELARETARTLHRVGDLYGLLHQLTDARTAYERAIASYDALLENAAAAPGLELEAARCLVGLARAERTLGALDSSERAGRDAVLRLTALVDRGEQGADASLLTARLELAGLLAFTDRQPEARAELEAGLEASQALLDEQPDDPEVMETRAALLEELARLLENIGDRLLTDEEEAVERERAVELYEESLTLREKLVARAPDDAQLRQQLATSAVHLGGLCSLMGDAERGSELLAVGMETLETLVRDFPSVPRYASNLASVHVDLGSEAGRAGRFEEAGTHLEQAAAAFRDLVARFPDLPDFRHRLGVTLVNLSTMYLYSGDPARAAELAHEAVEATQAALTANDGSTEYRKAARFAQAARAQASVALGEYQDAAGAARGLVEIFPDQGEFHGAARFLGQCVALVQADEALSPQRREELTREYLDGVFSNLERAVEHQLADPLSPLQTDPVFAAVRAHGSFEARLAALKASIED